MGKKLYTLRRCRFFFSLNIILWLNIRMKPEDAAGSRQLRNGSEETVTTVLCLRNTNSICLWIVIWHNEQHIQKSLHSYVEWAVSFSWEHARCQNASTDAAASLPHLPSEKGERLRPHKLTCYSRKWSETFKPVFVLSQENLICLLCLADNLCDAQIYLTRQGYY